MQAMRFLGFRGVLIGSALIVSGVAAATDLTFTGVADDYFTASVSTDPTLAGTIFADQTNTWQGGGASGTITLTPGVTNYLNIFARDAFGAPSMLIGQASLSDADFFFPDGTQAILTSATDGNWTASIAGFGGTAASLLDLGANGSGPWGTQGAVSSSARRIWTDGTVSDLRYFQVAITPVPEPGTFALLGAAGFAAWLRSRRAKKAA